MANLHNSFLRFNNLISLSQQRLSKLSNSKNAIQNTIKYHFQKDWRFPTPKFFIQGSYKMNTIILKKDNTYDVDLGVYFESIPQIAPVTLQKNLLRAVEYQTSAGAIHKNKCIRVVYQGEFNIDLPVYYLDKKSNTPYLATKNSWEKSDPKELVEWFKINNGTNQQLQRLIKYIKAWSENNYYKMPSGIVITVWTAQNFSLNIREDIALINTLKNIRSKFRWSIKCINPSLPGDDLVASLSIDQKNRFLSEIEDLILALERSLNDQNQSRAIARLKKHFGLKFGL